MLFNIFPEIMKNKNIFANRIHDFDHSFKLLSDICEENYKRPRYAEFLHDFLVMEDELHDVEKCCTFFQEIYNNTNHNSFALNEMVEDELENCLREWIDAEKEYFKREYAELIRDEKIEFKDFIDVTRDKQTTLYCSGPGGYEFSEPQWFAMILMNDKDVVDEDMCYYLHYIDNYYHSFDEEGQKRYEEETFQGFKHDNPSILRTFKHEEDKTLKIMRGAFNFNIEKFPPNHWKFRNVLIEV